MHPTDTTDAVATGVLLRRMRGSKTLDEMAQEMGISKQYLSQLENGHRHFSERVMRSINRDFPDFRPVIKVEGANVHVSQQQSAESNMMDAARDTLEQANRTLQIANNLLELANEMMNRSK